MFRGQDKPDPEKLKKLQEAIGYLNSFLEGHNYAVGDSITIADHCLVASLSSFVECGIDISAHPNVVAWFNRCKSEMVGYEEANGCGAKEFGKMAKEKLGA